MWVDVPFVSGLCKTGVLLMFGKLFEMVPDGDAGSFSLEQHWTSEEIRLQTLPTVNSVLQRQFSIVLLLSRYPRIQAALKRGFSCEIITCSLGFGSMASTPPRGKRSLPVQNSKSLDLPRSRSILDRYAHVSHVNLCITCAYTEQNAR